MGLDRTLAARIQEAELEAELQHRDQLLAETNALLKKAEVGIAEQQSSTSSFSGPVQTDEEISDLKPEDEPTHNDGEPVEQMESDVMARLSRQNAASSELSKLEE